MTVQVEEYLEMEYATHAVIPNARHATQTISINASNAQTDSSIKKIVLIPVLTALEETLELRHVTLVPICVNLAMKRSVSNAFPISISKKIPTTALYVFLQNLS